MSVTPRHIKEWLVRQDEYMFRPKKDTIEVVRDPQVDGTFAVRFEDQDSNIGTVDLMFVTGYGSGNPDDILSNTLEEVEYSTWPPTSGNLQFFV